MVKCLIDADILCYEIGYGSQETKDGVVTPRSWNVCENLLNNRIETIRREVDSEEEPILYLTGSNYLTKLMNKKRKFMGEEQVPHKENFRFEVAKTKKYKGTRKSDKPYHFHNIINYMLNNYNTIVSEDGLEADDHMCIEQYKTWKDRDTIICSRDKDLKQCPGLHFTWELAASPSWGPIFVDELGFIEDYNEGKTHPKTGKPLPMKVRGVGDMFFYYQMLIGDNVDNILGVRGRGPVFAYNLLKDVTTQREAYELVAEKYVQAFDEDWEKMWNEMSQLLWMVREKDENGEAIGWRKPLSPAEEEANDFS